MFSHRIASTTIVQPHYFLQRAVYAAHSKTCPAAMKKGAVCPGSGKSGSSGKSGDLKRAQHSGKCRLGFVPEEWFTFFGPKTGVSGPYILGIVLTNYMFSKEIFVMEHEYYSGLSILLMILIVMKNFSSDIGASLDKGVDEIAEGWEKGRRDEVANYENIIKAAKDAQWRAEGQKLLMDAKKENITMQLEAIYRERFMHVYRSVRGRMDYHVKRYRAEARIHQKWMIGWILENVRKSITPEFEKQALESAIRDLAGAASRA